MNRTSLLHLLALVVIFSFRTHGDLCAQNFADIQANLGDKWSPRFDLGDYDQDGDLDVVATGMAGSSANVPLTSIYRNDGGGVFTTLPFSIPLAGSDIGWLDLDGDRDLDFYMVSTVGFPAQTSLHFYRNDSSLGFNYMNSGVQMVGTSLEWADFDNDGDPDILHATYPGGPNSATYIYRNLGNGTFQPATHNLPYLILDGISAVGDYDNDGDADIVGRGNTNGYYIYRNDGDLNFTAIPSALSQGATEYKFGDYDSDGDLDLASSTGLLYQNDAGTFTQVATFAGASGFGFLDWGDYDNDGDLDILNAGDMYLPMYYLPPIMYIHRNDGNNVFTTINFANSGLHSGDVRWGDFDNDGKLDIFAFGHLDNWFPRRAMIFQNTGSAPANTVPAAPSGLQASIAPDSTIIFRWNRASDAITPDSGLSYRLWISTSSGLPGIPDQASPLSDIATGQRMIARKGNLQDTSWNMRTFPLGQTFYARIQAVDGGLMGSGWSSAVAVTDTLLGGSIDTAVIAGTCQLNAPGAVYVDSIRWYQCSPWQMVPGADQATFQPGNTNAYAAVLYMGTATDTTACASTIPAQGIDTTVQVYPCYASGIGAAQADSVQWIDCNTQLPLPGETNAALYPTITGDYALVYYHCNGTDTSGCHTLQHNSLSSTVIANSCGLSTTLPSLTDSVQWIDCNTMLAVPGADDSTFTPSSAGDYAVVFYTCQTTDTSACVSWTPFVLNTAIVASGAVLSLPGGPQADSIKWLWCDAGPNSGPMADNTSSVFPAIVSGSYRAILYHCNDSDTTACQYVDAQFVRLSAVAAPIVNEQASDLDWGDYDNDGDLDLLVIGRTASASESTNLYRNNGNGTFSNISTTLPNLSSGAAAWGDYDNDGDLDILITGWQISITTARSQIYRNDGGGVFTDIQSGIGILGLFDCSWVDYDNDGDLDVFAGKGNPSVGRLYRNDGAGQFTLEPVLFDGAGTRWSDWGDYDNDGDLDLVFGAYASGSNTGITRLYRNDGNGVFVSLPHNFPGLVRGSYHWEDYDADGYLDLFMSGTNSNNQRMANLYHNNNGTSFSPVATPFRGFESGTADWGDFDNDGLIDLALTGEGFPMNRGVRLYRNLGNSAFEEITTWPSQFGQGKMQWGDFDHDGDLDLAVGGNTLEGWMTLIYRNDSVPSPNQIPIAPSIVNAVPGSSGSINFSWSPGSDATTPTAGLSYQLMVGTTPGGREVVSPMTDTANGWRLIPARGPLQTLSWTLGNVQNGQSYYARVFAIDAGRSASQPSATGVLLGTDQAGKPLLLQAGPIPTSDWLLVKVPILEVESRLDLVDLQGRNVLSQVVSANQAGEVKIDLSELASGTYLLQWKSAEVAEVLTMKVVKE